MNTLESAFELLGISPDCDPATARRAWRALVRRFHPDMAKTDRDGANRRLAEINAAFDAITTCSDADRARLMARADGKARGTANRHRTNGNPRGTSRGAPHSDHPAQAGAGGAAASGPGHKTQRSADPAPAREKPAAAADQRAFRQLAWQAANAFLTARRVCSQDRKAEPRSTYV